MILTYDELTRPSFDPVLMKHINLVDSVTTAIVSHQEPRHLGMTKNYNEPMNYASNSSSFCESVGSVSSMTTRSVTSVLSSAMAAALTFSDQSPVAVCPKQSIAYQMSSAPFDFVWLLERCGGESQLMLDVLRSFCEQGQYHLNAVQISAKESNMKQLSFHAVK